MELRRRHDGVGRADDPSFTSCGQSTPVTLTVTDDRGLQRSISKRVSVRASRPDGGLRRSRRRPRGRARASSSTRPRSTAGAGRTIVSYDWNFGTDRTRIGRDGLEAVRRGREPTTVTLVVTDDVGQTARPRTAVPSRSPTTSGRPVRRSRPRSPTVNQQIVFNAARSSASRRPHDRQLRVGHRRGQRADRRTVSKAYDVAGTTP